MGKQIDADKVMDFINKEIERTESFAEHETLINVLFYVQELIGKEP